MDIVHTAIRDDKLETYYNDGGIGRGADVLRFFLTPRICIVSFGFPTLFDANIPHLSDYVAVLCNFILPVFFILSGFFVLPADEKVRREKLNRAVKRTGLFFVCLAVCMLLFAYLYYVLLYKIYNPQVSLSTLASYHASGFRTLASSKRV